MTVEISVKTTGPLFTRAARELPRKAIEDILREAVEDGEERLAERLRPRPAGVFLSVAQAGRAVSKGNYRRHLQTRTKGLRATLSDGGVVYGPWLEGTSNRNNTTRFKGYRQFRKTSQWLSKYRVPRILKKHVTSMAMRLSGGI